MQKSGIKETPNAIKLTKPLKPANPAIFEDFAKF